METNERTYVVVDRDYRDHQFRQLKPGSEFKLTVYKNHEYFYGYRNPARAMVWYYAPECHVMEIYQSGVVLVSDNRSVDKDVDVMSTEVKVLREIGLDEVAKLSAEITARDKNGMDVLYACGTLATLSTHEDDEVMYSDGSGSCLSASGYRDILINEGSLCKMALSGDRYVAVSNGKDTNIVCCGSRGVVMATGDRATITATGFCTRIYAPGKDCAITCLREDCWVLAGMGSRLIMEEREYDGEEKDYVSKGVHVVTIDGKEYKPGVWYHAKEGKITEY